MKEELLDHLREYSELLRLGSVWHNSKELLAPIFDDNNVIASENYIYEFYCFISIISDLRKNYILEFVPGTGQFQFKFPQAAATKKGKPKFQAIEKDEPIFQICAGTMIEGRVPSEENHPDISFQKATATDNPTYEDLILIMDAKYRENSKSPLSKDEVYKFGMILTLFALNNSQIADIKFDQLKEFSCNCLITNGKVHNAADDLQILKLFSFKEIVNFAPNSVYSVFG